MIHVVILEFWQARQTTVKIEFCHIVIVQLSDGQWKIIMPAIMDSTLLKNQRKSLIQNCERSELRLHFQWTKLIKNAKNSPF